MTGPIGRAVVPLIAFLAASAVAHAESPREALTLMVEQVQKTPADNALREKIIKLARTLKPAPALPEEASRSFARGNVFQKEAKDASDYELAISAYRDAVRVAPWWGDAYYNLAVALESAQKFDEATASIKLYMASLDAGSAEAREAQNRIYAVEAKSEMAAKTAAETAAVASVKRFEGDWKRWDGPSDLDAAGHRVWHELHIKRGTSGWVIRENVSAAGALPFPPKVDIRFTGSELQYTVEHTYVGEGTPCARYRERLAVSPDGNTLTETSALLPFPPNRPSNCLHESTYLKTLGLNGWSFEWERQREQ